MTADQEKLLRNIEETRAGFGLAPPQTASHPSRPASKWSARMSAPRQTTDQGKAGLLCPECQAADTRAIDSRPMAGRTYRRRRCINEHRFTTYEIQASDLTEFIVEGVFGVLFVPCFVLLTCVLLRQQTRLEN